MKRKWKKIEGGKNIIMQLKDCQISYNPSIRSTAALGGETAIIKNNECFVLVGDYRKQFEKCKNFEKCKKIFDRNPSAHWGNNFGKEAAILDILANIN
jgi:hypothetical protein